MKRLALALVLAAVVPATGCWSECTSSVTVDWPTFLLADGSTPSDCATALGPGATTIDVWVNDAYAATFDCNGPAGVVHLGRGSNLVTVEGRDASGVIRLRDEFNVDGSSCGNQGTVAARPAEGRVDVAYHFSPFDQCYQGAQSYVWVHVVDDLANEVAADSSAAPTSGNACGLDFPLSIRLAAGDYSLTSTREMIASGPTFVQVAGDCASHAFHVAGASATTVTPVLDTSTLSCP